MPPAVESKPADLSAVSGERPAARPRRSFASRIQETVEAAWRPLLVLLLIFLAWWFITAQGWVKPYLLPSPGRVWNTMVADRQLLLKHTSITMYETVVGFVFAAIFGLLAAIGIVYSPTIEKSVYPLLLFAQVIPKIAIAPLFVVWLGFGPEPKILVAVLIAFFPVVIPAVAGLRAVDPELLDLAATMGASEWQKFSKIRFPASLPFVFSGLKVAVTFAVVGAVVGEFVGASSGLGYLLLIANGNLDAPLLFAGLIIMSLIGVVLFVVFEGLEWVLLPWQASRRTTVTATT